MDKDQLRSVIERTLVYIEDEVPTSPHAVELLMLTSAQESGLGYYVEQIRGPADGIFQMEPSTERDIWENYLVYHPELAVIVGSFMTPTEEDSDLTTNLVYQILMARIHYRRVSEALPTSPEGYAEYYKKYYNTHLGKATAEEALENYKRLAL